MTGTVRTWDAWTAQRLAEMDRRNLLRSLRPLLPFDAFDARRQGGDDDDVDGGVDRPSSGLSFGRVPSPASFSSSPASRPAHPSFPSPSSSSSSPMEVRVAPETMRAWLAGEHDLGTSFSASHVSSSLSGARQASPSTTTAPSTSESYYGEGDEAPTATASPGQWCRLRLFSSNDYLGMSTHPVVRAAAASAAARWGSGPRSSALVCGGGSPHSAPCGVWGVGCGVWGVGCEVQGARVWGGGCGVRGAVCKGVVCTVHLTADNAPTDCGSLFSSAATDRKPTTLTPRKRDSMWSASKGGAGCLLST
jgi:hypothetical protein